MTRRTLARSALLAVGGAMVANVATMPVGAQTIGTPTPMRVVLLVVLGLAVWAFRTARATAPVAAGETAV